jgi:hypothetical protein
MFGKILVIGSDNTRIFNKKYNTLGNHSCSIYGKNMDNNNENYWIDFYNFLDGYKYNAIFFDTNSQHWLEKLDQKVLNTCLEILYGVISNNGIIITEAYNIHTKKEFNISSFLSNLKDITKKLLRFSDSSQYIYYIYSNTENLSKIIKSFEDIYPDDFEAITVNKNEIIWNIYPVIEKDAFQFFERRLKFN